MKYRVNLYQASLKPEIKLISANKVSIAASLVVVFLVTALIMIKVSTASLQSKVNKQQAELTELQNEVATLNARVSNARVAPELVRSERVLEREVTAKTRLLQRFDTTNRLSNIDFSQVLGDLSRVHIEGIWLTRIYADQSGLEIYGKTVQPAAIPNWMERFKEVDTLSPYRFSVVELQRDSERALNFAIVSSPREVASSGTRQARGSQQ
ncbi:MULTISPECIES: PilN domain-containing protein [Gammaproteobacteria]|uniref:PilN domain-containing protein n=1 Tax=Gammaproteobacteria TaxID=1236 RepID=UPI000DCF8C16|nr:MULTISPECIES: PilN domain-containing protein [Gammaproteobacteria]RTE86394.1 hypothetical protein DQX04_07480 [Aliidiomarina sp. B3213]TCZ91741.1 hypothetical protein EYQ95_07485 [Lysobacter sp. N42]